MPSLRTMFGQKPRGSTAADKGADKGAATTGSRPREPVVVAWDPPYESMAATGWHQTRASAQVRELVEEALVPTLRYYAASLAGKPVPVPPGGLVYASAAGLRWGLIEGLAASRVITPQMFAAAWWHYLSQGERATLTTLVEQGLGLERPGPGSATQGTLLG